MEVRVVGGGGLCTGRRGGRPGLTGEMGYSIGRWACMEAQAVGAGEHEQREEVIEEIETRCRGGCGYGLNPQWRRERIVDRLMGFEPGWQVVVCFLGGVFPVCLSSKVYWYFGTK